VRERCTIRSRTLFAGSCAGNTCSARMDTPLSNLLRRRRTAKLLGDPAAPLPVRDLGDLPLDILAVASWAPFHHALPGHAPEPWRVHMVGASSCRILAGEMMGQSEAGKIPGMLSTADVLYFVTWKPSGMFSRGRKPSFEGNLVNMEHVAAVSAYIQNLLLLGTEAGFDTYWSSGGLLAERAAYERLGVPDDELLLGAVFLFPMESQSAQRVTGKHREKRTGWEQWTRVVDLGPVS